MSSRSFATSIPIKHVSMCTRPCKCGLALRPKRLFGFNGLTDGAPSSATVFIDLDAIGLPSAPATPTLRRRRDFDIQGRRGCAEGAEEEIARVARFNSPR